MICGIDPGKSGGIVYIHHLTQKIEGFYPFDGKVKPVMTGSHAFIEHAQAMPKQGVVGMFNYGVSFGRILGAVEAHNITYTLVKPQEWHKVIYAGIDGLEGKERSLEAAYRANPDSLKLFTIGKRRKPHMGLVEAYLIGLWGLHMSRNQ